MKSLTHVFASSHIFSFLINSKQSNHHHHSFISHILICIKLIVKFIHTSEDLCSSSVVVMASFSFTLPKNSLPSLLPNHTPRALCSQHLSMNPRSSQSSQFFGLRLSYPSKFVQSSGPVKTCIVAAEVLNTLFDW